MERTGRIRFRRRSAVTERPRRGTTATVHMRAADTPWRAAELRTRSHCAPRGAQRRPVAIAVDVPDDAPATERVLVD